MSMKRQFVAGPQLLTTAAVNVLTPGTITGGIVWLAGAISTWASLPTPNMRLIIYHIRAVNTSATNRAVSCYIGTTGIDTDAATVIWGTKAVAANDFLDFYTPGLVLDVGKFLVAEASFDNVVTLLVIGEMGVA